MTYTYVLMTVSKSTFDEVKAALVEAEYHQAIVDPGTPEETLDMHGLALVCKPEPVNPNPDPLSLLELIECVKANHQPDRPPKENFVGQEVGVLTYCKACSRAWPCVAYELAARVPS